MRPMLSDTIVSYLRQAQAPASDGLFGLSLPFLLIVMMVSVDITWLKADRSMQALVAMAVAAAQSR